jgi:hypothetical protein
MVLGLVQRRRRAETFFGGLGRMLLVTAISAAARNTGNHTLSALGKRTLLPAQTLLRERLSSLLADLPPPEADALARALPRVEATVSGVPPPRRAPPPLIHRGLGDIAEGVCHLLGRSATRGSGQTGGPCDPP